MHNADRVLDVDHHGNSGSGFSVKFSDLADMLENLAAEVLFDKQKHDVSLRIGAYILAIGRVVEVYRLRGTYS